MNFIKKTAVMLILVLLAGLCGCKENENTDPVIAVTIVPQASFVNAVAGELFQTVTMVPPGASPENYEPSPKEAAALNDAVLYFSIGVPAESASLLAKIPLTTRIVNLADECAKECPIRKIGESNDPHVWLSPKRVIVMIKAIERELCAVDAANASVYSANADQYIAELNALDARLSAAFSKMKTKKIIVFHPAFGYLADDYGIEMLAIEEEGKEATAQHMGNMVDLAKREGIKAVFYQAEVDSSQAQAFAESIGGKTVMLAPLDGDYIANLDKMAALITDIGEEK